MTSRLAGLTAKTFTKRHLAMAARALGPVLVATVLSPIAAHAQGTVDLTGVTTANRTTPP